MAYGFVDEEIALPTYHLCDEINRYIRLLRANHIVVDLTQDKQGNVRATYRLDFDFSLRLVTDERKTFKSAADKAAKKLPIIAELWGCIDAFNKRIQQCHDYDYHVHVKLSDLHTTEGWIGLSISRRVPHPPDPQREQAKQHLMLCAIIDCAKIKHKDLPSMITAFRERWGEASTELLLGAERRSGISFLDRESIDAAHT